MGFFAIRTSVLLNDKSVTLSSGSIPPVILSVPPVILSEAKNLLPQQTRPQTANSVRAACRARAVAILTTAPLVLYLDPVGGESWQKLGITTTISDIGEYNAITAPEVYEVTEGR